MNVTVGKEDNPEIVVKFPGYKDLETHDVGVVTDVTKKSQKRKFMKTDFYHDSGKSK